MLKCDLHMHSSWSDGQQGIQEMLNACEVAGLKKVAVTDHYKSTTNFTVQNYCDEIENYKNQYSFELLKGVELQWDQDCGLDYFSADDREHLDITLCELMGELLFHPDSPRWEPERKDKSKLIATAFDLYRKIAVHPLVDVIAHPFNFGRMHLDYDFELADLPREELQELAEMMAQNNTAYELQSQFYYWYPKMRVGKLLQQQVEIAKLFKEAGVKFSIGTDAHNVGTTGNTRWSEKVLQYAGIGPESLIREALA